MVQAKLIVNPPGDAYEQEADRVADAVTHGAALPFTRSVPFAGGPGVQRMCKACEDDQPLQRASRADAHTRPAIDAELQATVPTSGGSPLSESIRRDLEPRIGFDFSAIRIHTDAAAASSAAALGARAYTAGRHVVFGAGQYAPGTPAGRRLLAHELVHTVQQGAAARPGTAAQPGTAGLGPAPAVAGAIQRDTFVGASGVTASDKVRPLLTFPGALPAAATTGGTIVPGTASTLQNCAGDSISASRWVDWPSLGLQAAGVSDPRLTGDWAAARAFVPTGCTRVSNAGISVYSTRCNNASELELIAFLYRWPAGAVEDPVARRAITVYQSDFHMVGRSVAAMPSGWHSKMDRRERVVDIRDPEQSLHDAYPHTLRPDREVVRLTFCCTPGSIRTA